MRTEKREEPVYDYSDTAKALAVPGGEAGLKVLAAELMQCLADVEAKAEALKQAEQRLASVAEQRLPDLMQELSIDNYTYTDPNTGQKFKVEYVEKIRCSIPPDTTDEQRAAIFEWLRGNGLEGVIKKRVEANIGLAKPDEIAAIVAAINEAAPNVEVSIAEKVEPATLTSVVSKLMDKGELPSEYLKVTPVREARAKAARTR